MVEIVGEGVAPLTIDSPGCRGFIKCDNCVFYHWYYDYCSKWDCEVDAREVHGCIELREM